jgi:hypothetical protein
MTSISSCVPELLINPLQLKPLADTLRRLGYQAVRGAENYQFAKPGPTGGLEGSIKIDLLTGPQSRFRETSAKVDARRVRPRPSVELHAHPVDEALTLEDDLLPVTLEGGLADGSSVQAVGLSASPIDLRDDETVCLSGSGQRREQAVTEVLLTRSAFTGSSPRMSQKSGGTARWNYASFIRPATQIKEAGRIARTSISPQLSHQGMVRMRESPYCRAGLQLEEFWCYSGNFSALLTDRTQS